MSPLEFKNMQSLYKTVYLESARKAVSRETLFKKPGNREKIARQHLNIYQAIQARDPETAAREASLHIDFVAEELRRMLDATLTQV